MERESKRRRKGEEKRTEGREAKGREGCQAERRGKLKRVINVKEGGGTKVGMEGEKGGREGRARTVNYHRRGQSVEIYPFYHI